MTASVSSGLTSQVRDTRSSSLHKAHRSILERSERLSPDQLAGYQHFYNGMVGHIDGLKVSQAELERTLPLRPEDREILIATEARSDDDTPTADLRQQYQDAHRQVRRETARAARLSARLGVGEHPQENGDHVSIEELGEGRRSVSTRRADGGLRAAILGGPLAEATLCQPGDEPTHLSQQGSTISRQQANQRDRFQVKEGQPTRETSHEPSRKIEFEVRSLGRIETVRLFCQKQGQFQQDKAHWDTYRLDFTTLGRDATDPIYCTLLVSLAKGVSNPDQAIKQVVTRHILALNQKDDLKTPGQYQVKSRGQEELEIQEGLPPGTYRGEEGMPPASVGNRRREKLKPKDTPLPTQAGQAVEIQVTHAGTLVKASLRKVAREGDRDVYQVQVGANSFQLKVGTAVPAETAATSARRVLQEYVKIPAQFRAVIKEIQLESGGSPDDKYWEKQYGMKGFTSAACAGGGVLTIFNVAKDGGAIEHAFAHETGHLVGEAVRNEQAWFASFRTLPKYPEGWAEAAKKDGVMEGFKTIKDGKVINYSEADPAEDFAESFQNYLNATIQGPEAVRKFQQKYPNRAKILADIFSGKLEI